MNRIDGCFLRAQFYTISNWVTQRINCSDMFSVGNLDEYTVHIDTHTLVAISIPNLCGLLIYSFVCMFFLLSHSFLLSFWSISKLARRNFL